MPRHWIDHYALAALDLETTGPDPATARPVAAALTLHRGIRWRPAPGWPLAIAPGIAIEPQAVAAHGITDAEAARGMELRRALAVMAETVALLARTGWVLAGANIAYDLAVIEACCAREGVAGVAARTPSALVVDGMLLDHCWRRERPRCGPGAVQRNLAGLCAHYGIALERAHDCTHDAVAAAGLAVAVLRTSAGPHAPEEGRWGRERLAELRACAGPGELTALQRRWWRWEQYRRGVDPGAGWPVP